MFMRVVSFPFTYSPILRRRHPCHFFKGAGKIILIWKAAGFCNFGNGLIGEIQQLLCPVDSDSQHKLHRRHAGDLLKNPAKMDFAHLAEISTFRYGDIQIRNHFNVTDHFTDFILAFFFTILVVWFIRKKNIFLILSRKRIRNRSKRRNRSAKKKSRISVIKSMF